MVVYLTAIYWAEDSLFSVLTLYTYPYHRSLWRVYHMSRRWRCSRCCPESSLRSSQSSWLSQVSIGQTERVLLVCYANSLGTFLQIVCGYPSKQRIKYYDYICLPMMVFLSFSLMTMGVPLSKSPGNSWSFNWTGCDFVICDAIENSDSSKDSDLYSIHQCFPLEI